ncbi:histone-like nucleoid-structuring protein Lsr2 [Amycolatopsis sp. CA-230715]|uniref:histone-like nucleoid-structuring protein Lsr2 n=1 Tax=Amycolatopsis sp. CA-230715 TaxID=2745196 RepID=UPI001C00CD25|nr:Lsr2 family protein [Amycolatopsis sp. CA-230715]QWF85850.1 Nucleoid-associated protein Lsr2 [Amycolatopsis sp. CA-230715]
MAQQVSVEMVDDIDGSEAAETVRFGLDGVDYDIDLSRDNADELRDALAQYVERGRRAGGRKRRGGITTGAARSAPPTPAQRQRNQDIRAWAEENGYALSERGRIPANVIAEYDAAQQTPAKPARTRSTTKRGRKAAAA